MFLFYSYKKETRPWQRTTCTSIPKSCPSPDFVRTAFPILETIRLGIYIYIYIFLMKATLEDTRSWKDRMFFIRLHHVIRSWLGKNHIFGPQRYIRISGNGCSHAKFLPRQASGASWILRSFSLFHTYKIVITKGEEVKCFEAQQWWCQGRKKGRGFTWVTDGFSFKWRQLFCLETPIFCLKCRIIHY